LHDLLNTLHILGIFLVICFISLLDLFYLFVSIERKRQVEPSSGRIHTIGLRIHDIRSIGERRKATSKESFFQTIRAEVEEKVSVGDSRHDNGSQPGQNIQLGQISYRAKPTKALPKNTPSTLVGWIILGQYIADCLTVTHNVVRAEVLEILCLLDCITLASKCSRCDGRAEASSSLVQKQHLVNGLTSIHTQYSK
jgi:hypothetical protein